MQQTMITVTADDIRLAMEAGAAAAHRRLPRGAARALATAGISDTPQNRALAAVAALFGGEKLTALMTRINALNEVMQDDQARAYVQRSTIGLPGDEVEPVVVEIAASFPLNVVGKFDRRAFFDAVALAAGVAGNA